MVIASFTYLFTIVLIIYTLRYMHLTIIDVVEEEFKNDVQINKIMDELDENIFIIK